MNYLLVFYGLIIHNKRVKLTRQEKREILVAKGHMVDLEALKAREVVNPDNKTSVLVLDRVSLRKRWAARETYWIDLLWDKTQDVYQVYKSWNWVKDGQPVVGRTGGGATKVQHVAVDRYLEAITGKIVGGDYVVVERQCSQKNLIPGFDQWLLRTKKEADCRAVPAVVDETPPEMPKEPPQRTDRQGKSDWW